MAGARRCACRAAFRFDTKEVFIDRNPRNGDVILSRKPANWSEVFAALDRAGVPGDLLADRDPSLPQERDGMNYLLDTNTVSYIVKGRMCAAKSVLKAPRPWVCGRERR